MDFCVCESESGHTAPWLVLGLFKGFPWARFVRNGRKMSAQKSADAIAQMCAKVFAARVDLPRHI
jgi:hypothetical protein